MEPYPPSPQIFPLSCLVKYMGKFTNHKKSLVEEQPVLDNYFWYPTQSVVSYL